MKSKSLVVLAAAALMAAGMAAAPGAVVAAGEKFVLVSHAPDSDSWWNTIKNAIEVAGEQMDVKVDYRNPPTGDLADMARIVEQASAADPNGIIVTIADFDVLQGPITDAVDKGIPVITINSGTKKQSEQLGALMHVGQPEYDAGFGAAVAHRLQDAVEGDDDRFERTDVAAGEKRGGGAGAGDRHPAARQVGEFARFAAHHHRAVALAHAGPGGHDPVVAADGEVGVGGDRGDREFGALRAVVQALDVFQDMLDLVVADADGALGQRAEHEGVVGVRAVPDAQDAVVAHGGFLPGGGNVGGAPGLRRGRAGRGVQAGGRSGREVSPARRAAAAATSGSPQSIGNTRCAAALAPARASRWAGRAIPAKRRRVSASV